MPAARGDLPQSRPEPAVRRRAEQRAVKVAVRSTCPVHTEYPVEGLDDRIEFGMRGGMTERERLPGSVVRH
ncbi:WhiB family transcriptional regulator [Amycolatopsis speibonae]|uniref:WhiB family transcriptional regulator n=1 Tax=Amycolatopsis speibonae TaxID=1450224 RepID=A0ABV7P0Y3_9PSEU